MKKAWLGSCLSGSGRAGEGTVPAAGNHYPERPVVSLVSRLRPSGEDAADGWLDPVTCFVPADAGHHQAKLGARCRRLHDGTVIGRGAGAGVTRPPLAWQP